MRVFIVHAHPDPASFNAAMTRAAVDALAEEGHEVEVSDLYAMRFDPLPGRHNFTTVKDHAQFRQQAEEAYASQNNGYVSELQAEMDKIAWCDVLIFQFPITWLGLPAILKGWVDRVFAVGRAYGGGRYFQTGIFGGKSAMCSVTLGGLASAYSSEGFYAPIGMVLYPVNHGIFAFCGFSVLEPFVVYGPNRITQAERTAELARYAERMRGLMTAPVIANARATS